MEGEKLCVSVIVRISKVFFPCLDLMNVDFASPYEKFTEGYLVLDALLGTP